MLFSSHLRPTNPSPTKTTYSKQLRRTLYFATHPLEPRLRALQLLPCTIKKLRRLRTRKNTHCGERYGKNYSIFLIFLLLFPNSEFLLSITHIQPEPRSIVAMARAHSTPQRGMQWHARTRLRAAGIPLSLLIGVASDINTFLRLLGVRSFISFSMKQV